MADELPIEHEAEEAVARVKRSGKSVFAEDAEKVEARAAGLTVEELREVRADMLRAWPERR
jgi:hypothetical protein